jgi:hypothetical protein
MEAYSDWYYGIEKRVNYQKDTLSEKDYRKYKLDLLLCLARRVDSFSALCAECQSRKQEITALTNDLANLSLMSKEAKKSYFKAIGDITKHLQKQHKLVTEGQYIGMGMTIGAAIGVALSAVLEGGGLPIGIAIGAAFGYYLDAKAKREGRVICPKEKKTVLASRNTFIAVILGVLILVGLIAAFIFGEPFG